MAKRYITISFDVAEEHPTQVGAARAIDAHETAIRDAVESTLHEHVRAGAILQFATTLSSNDPHAVADEVPPEHGAAYRDQADRHAAVDAMVHGHPDCKAGGTAHEHAKTLLDVIRQKDRGISEMSALLAEVREVDPKTLAAAEERRRQKVIAAAARAAEAAKRHAEMVESNKQLEQAMVAEANPDT